ncbi:DUF6624 domain-containing protein [Streptomyces mobaraensis]|uniref:DUF6624 domain-containing protein n=1 Tax=Streptomyces mobaraensis TaxID=35621 RepID=UPI003332DE6C
MDDLLPDARHAARPGGVAVEGRMVLPARSWPCPRLDVLSLLFRLHSEGLAARTLAGPVPDEHEMRHLLRYEQRATRELRQVFDAHGWPGVSVVGEIGAEAAWWLAMTCDRHSVFQHDAAGLLAEAVEAGDAPARHAASLEDRLLMHDGDRQTFGTQWVLHDDGSITLYPVADRAALAERRREVGLPETVDEREVRLLCLTRRPRPHAPSPTRTL